MSSRRGFTLIEMLLVVSIIVILISMLLPALKTGKENAMETTCKARLKMLYEGHLVYSVANQSNFPHYNNWLWTGPKSVSSEQWVEYGAIWPYVRDREMYFCPKDDKRRDPGTLAIGSGGAKGNYPIHTYVRMMEPHNQFRSRLIAGGASAQQASDAANYLGPRVMKPGCFSPLPGSGLPASAWAGAPRSLADVALIFEEASSNTDFVGPDDSWALLNDGHSYFSYKQDQMSARHQGNAHIQYWDGHSEKVNSSYFNNWPIDHNPTAEEIAFGVQ